MNDAMTYGTSISVHRSFRDTVAATRAAPADEGFGVLTEIDVPATLKAKLGVDIEPQLILGACDPTWPTGPCRAEPDIGLLLPTSCRRQRQANDRP